MHLPGADLNPNPNQVETMITVDVHQRDCYDELVQKKIREPDHFDWQKQARRLYWMHTPTPTTGCLCLTLTLTLTLTGPNPYKATPNQETSRWARRRAGTLHARRPSLVSTPASTRWWRAICPMAFSTESLP